jgi:CubicO group peptidase (beta-lactamase class C family)
MSRGLRIDDHVRIDSAHWQRRLTTLAEQHQVPGATLGILRLGDSGDDELVEAAYGVLNKATGVAATTDSLFQFGSITKVWTATLVMLLVEQGLLDHETPIVDVLPELELADPDTTKRVTMQHLLTHTSGIDGDVFTDTGRGDDCLEKYVALLADVPANHPLGATFSYSNSAYALAGRVIERVTGRTWDEAIRERIVTPLGLKRTVTLPEEALLHRVAVGHLAYAGAELEPARQWVLPRSIAPCGLIISTVADVLAFARLHLTGGLAVDGSRVLSQASIAAMAAKHADLPDRHTIGDSWGLGWARYEWEGNQVIGHDGATIGQAAFLRLLPAKGLAVVLLTNGGGSADLYQDLFREIFAEVAAVNLPRPLSAPANPIDVDLSQHVGRYERTGARIEIFERDGAAVLRSTTTGPAADLFGNPVQEGVMTAVDASGDVFVVALPPARSARPVTFYQLPGGQKYLHFGGRATPKVG